MAVLCRQGSGHGGGGHDGLTEGVVLFDKIASFPHTAASTPPGRSMASGGSRFGESEAALKNWIDTVILPTLAPEGGTALETTYHQAHKVAWHRETMTGRAIASGR